MVIGSVITLIGAIIQASAQAKRDLIAGRVVLGVGTVMLGPSAQSYAVGKLRYLFYKYFLLLKDTSLFLQRNVSSRISWCYGRCIPRMLFSGNE